MRHSWTKLGTAVPGGGKDYLKTAERLASDKKRDAPLPLDARKMHTMSGERQKMRELVVSTEMQELLLK